jgi:hypothetical protein
MTQVAVDGKKKKEEEKGEEKGYTLNVPVKKAQTGRHVPRLNWAWQSQNCQQQRRAAFLKKSHLWTSLLATERYGAENECLLFGNLTHPWVTSVVSFTWLCLCPLTFSRQVLVNQ